MFDWFRRKKIKDDTATGIGNKFHVESMYKLKDGIELPASDILELMMYLNTNTIIPYGIKIPQGFSAISYRQYDNLPIKFKEYFYKTEITFETIDLER